MRSILAILLTALLSIAATSTLLGQSYLDSLLLPDSLKQKRAIADSISLQQDPFQLIGERTPFGKGAINIKQSRAIEEGVKRYISNGPSRKLRGYRVRIYFDNRQNARIKSEEIVSLFQESYPYIPVYRSYDNPYFKVSVGDLRNRSEAVGLLNRLKREFPSAFVVRENINFP